MQLARRFVGRSTNWMPVICEHVIGEAGERLPQLVSAHSASSRKANFQVRSMATTNSACSGCARPDRCESNG
jgi:hypothetical protein